MIWKIDMNKAIQIIDHIKHRNKYATQNFLVLDRMPIFKYEKKVCDGKTFLIAEDSGFFSFYKYDSPAGRFVAFAGRKFDIPMLDGSMLDATGQWWDGRPEEYNGLIYSIGVSTVDRLGKCNVFSSMNIDIDIVDAALININASNNYHKYETRSKDFGNHKIVSKWEKINNE